MSRRVPSPSPEPEPEPPTPTPSDDPQLTVTPTYGSLSNANYGSSDKPFSIQLSYYGNGDITLTGHHPYHSTIRFNTTNKTLIFTSKGGYNYYGGTEEYAKVMTVNLSASGTYQAATVNFQWYSTSTSSQYPTFEEDPEPIQKE